ncbi:MAG: hypothetical protein BM557_08280 [Flavobacterium sp. MedPE-SWcel]|uniref:RDD family protein n=1 Tax=uncultured Flavobacterium sp. TaxID=165435 RepID=UPI0009163830|nr:RDD family protein [uncultured Flavobacterium sp.]OIQ17675.1 MAG: hypothetical protein BM557_08280 [Flavobacterium sp. MedPE-SWcel]
MEYQDNTVYIEDEMLATKGKRFANLIIDFIVQLIIGVLIGVFAAVLYYAFEIDGFLIWISGLNFIQERFLGVMIAIFYYGIFETNSSRSLGKLITGTKVVMYDGSKPDSKVILIRSLCRLIPFEGLSFLGSTGRGWHDSISNTYVVDTKKYDEAVRLKNSFDEIGKEEVL